jgi:ATP-dependent DNA ligase
VWKARAEVEKRHLKFDNVIFNIDKYKGEDFSKKPYGEKIKLLEEIQNKLPQLRLPTMAKTPNDKRRLYESIKSGRHPRTTEGFVIWDLDSDIPIKSKLKSDTELYVQGYEEGKGRLTGKLGAILATRDKAGKGPVTRVGGGFTDFEREQIWNNKLHFLGKPMTVEFQEALPSGKLRMPIFKVFRTAEFWPT